MPATWRFEHDVLVVVLTEIAEPADVRRAWLAASGDAAFRTGMPLIIDRRLAPTASPLRITSPLFASLLARGLARLCAIVVDPSARAAALDALRPLVAQGVAIGVFTDLESALFWARSSVLGDIGPPAVHAVRPREPSVDGV
jgi:hypothetical protein